MRETCKFSLILLESLDLSPDRGLNQEEQIRYGINLISCQNASRLDRVVPFSGAFSPMFALLDTPPPQTEAVRRLATDDDPHDMKSLQKSEKRPPRSVANGGAPSFREKYRSSSKRTCSTEWLHGIHTPTEILRCMTHNMGRTWVISSSAFSRFHSSSSTQIFARLQPLMIIPRGSQQRDGFDDSETPQILPSIREDDSDRGKTCRRATIVLPSSADAIGAKNSSLILIMRLRTEHCCE